MFMSINTPKDQTSLVGVITTPLLERLLKFRSLRARHSVLGEDLRQKNLNYSGPALPHQIKR